MAQLEHEGHVSEQIHDILCQAQGSAGAPSPPGGDNIHRIINRYVRYDYAFTLITPYWDFSLGMP